MSRLQTFDADRRPRYIRGYPLAGAGTKLHAVPVRSDDPRPTGHAHGTRKVALCGIEVSPKHTSWKPNNKHACRLCVARAEKEQQ